MNHEKPQSARKAVYTVIDRGDKKARWIRIGIAFVNRDGSLNVVLDALPVNGSLHIRDFQPQEGQDARGLEDEPTSRSERLAS